MRLRLGLPPLGDGPLRLLSNEARTYLPEPPNDRDSPADGTAAGPSALLATATDSPLLRLFRAIDQASLQAGDVRAATRLVVAEVCRYLDWPLGHAYAVEGEGGPLVPMAVWYDMRPGAHEPFVQATEATRFEAGEDLVGEALAKGGPHWVDLVGARGFARAETAEEVGLRLGMAVPAPAEGGGVVLEFFTHEGAHPDEAAVAALEHVGALWGRELDRRRLETSLRRSEERYRTIMESATDAVLVADADGRILSWNPAATRMFGYEPDEILGQDLTTLMPEAYWEAHRRAFARAGASGEVSNRIREVEGLSKGGRVFPVELSLSTWKSDQRYFAGIMRDVSVRAAAEEELRLLASATAHVRDAVLVSTSGRSGRGPTILYVNAAFSRMTGYSETDVLGQSFDVLVGPKTDREALASMHQRMREGQAASAEIVAYGRDGTDFLLEWQASPIYESDGTVRHFASIQRDVTEDRRVQHALRRADRDPLTGLPSRQVLTKRLERAIERVQERGDYRYALLFLDLDGFKGVNDEHGHVVGDQLLSSVAGRLERTIRPGDTVSRFGGDEFVILLEYVTGITDVILVAERVRERLSDPFTIQRRTLKVAASIGVALGETGYDSAEEVIVGADEAMYDAKRRGKGRVGFADKSRYAEVVAVLGLQDDLRQSLVREELELHYQPLVDLSTQTITGFEALVRWRHPELGLLLPDRFIPLAEESGLIVPLGRWILRTACTHAQSWVRSTDSDAPLYLSVNISVHELSNPDLVASVQETLEETGFDPRRLQLELTESVFIESLQPIRDRIAALRQLGISVCIDDFGTGYSSLGHLHGLPVDKVKIDRLFIRQMGSGKENVEILRAILTLAGNLGLDVVAEGVESEIQHETLKSLACGYGQGFLFSRPVEPDRVNELLSLDGEGSR